MPSSAHRSAALAAAGLLLLTGCAADDAQDAAAAPAAVQAPPAAADGKAAWLSGMRGLCTTLAGKVSGMQMQAGMDGKITPQEVLDGEARSREAVAAFDQGYAALPAAPEAAEVRAFWDGFLARHRASLEPVLTAARAGDQAGVAAGFAGREKLRLGPDGLAALTANGLPEKCYFRTAYS